MLLASIHHARTHTHTKTPNDSWCRHELIYIHSIYTSVVQVKEICHLETTRYLSPWQQERWMRSRTKNTPETESRWVSCVTSNREFPISPNMFCCISEKESKGQNAVMVRRSTGKRLVSPV